MDFLHSDSYRRKTPLVPSKLLFLRRFKRNGINAMTNGSKVYKYAYIVKQNILDYNKAFLKPSKRFFIIGLKIEMVTHA